MWTWWFCTCHAAAEKNNRSTSYHHDPIYLYNYMLYVYVGQFHIGGSKRQKLRSGVMVAPNLGGSAGYAAKSDVPWNFATIPEAISCLHWSSSMSNISQDSRLQDVKSANILCCSILLLYICWLLPFGESHQSFQDFLTSSTKSSSSSTAKETSESQKWTLDESKIATLWQFLVKLSNVKLPKLFFMSVRTKNFLTTGDGAPEAHASS